MKSRSEIWYALLAEAGRACSVSTTFDGQTVERRLAAEGDSFFTITLPAFEKDFLWSLAEGEIPTEAFQGWSRRKVRSLDGKVLRGIPNFLGGFLDLLFTTERVRWIDGEAHYETVPNPVLRRLDATERDFVLRARMACKAIRQLTLLFSKEKALCDQSKIDLAIQQYKSTDEEVTLPLPTPGQTPCSREDCSRRQREFFVSFLDQHYPL
jgi:hypothetical protein